jgi:CO/xanthine dehydrogenase Mo-binding subunit
MIARAPQTTKRVTDVFGASLSRRGFVKAGGALLAGFALVRADGLKAAATTAQRNTMNSGLPQSWIEIHADNTILMRVGKPDFGQGTVFTAYRQIVAEELNVPFEAITTVISGDTDRTPDGSGAFDFLSGGMPNIRKAADRPQRSAFRAKRHCIRWRQKRVLWRSGEEPETESHHSRQGRHQQHVRTDD